MTGFVCITLPVHRLGRTRLNTLQFWSSGLLLDLCCWVSTCAIFLQGQPQSLTHRWIQQSYQPLAIKTRRAIEGALCILFLALCSLKCRFCACFALPPVGSNSKPVLLFPVRLMQWTTWPPHREGGGKGEREKERESFHFYWAFLVLVPRLLLTRPSQT